MENRLKALKKYIQSEGRVCPMPIFWDDLWKILPDRKQGENGGWNPSLPLILAAWRDTTAKQKRQRLIQHIQHAVDRGVLEKVDEFLRELKPDQWAYGDGTIDWERWQSKNKVQK